MTELPTLRAVLRETAERRYGRRRRTRVIARGAVAGACALVAAGVGLALISAFGESRSADEVPATARPGSMFTPSPGATPSTTQGSVRFPRGNAIDVKDPKLRALLDPDHTIVRAWSVPAFKGHVLLSRKGGELCLSLPDTAADQPDVERGMGCEDGAQFGVSATIGSDYVAVVLDGGVKLPILRLPDDTQRTVRPLDGGLIALADVPAGSSITLFDGSGGNRTERFHASPALPNLPPSDPDASHGEKPVG
jgi:hypothetical protein